MSEQRPQHTQQETYTVTDRSGNQTILSRRGFLYGAVGVGALAAVGIGATIANSLPDAGDPSVEHLNVPENALTSLGELDVIEDPDDAVQLLRRFELPYGSLVWVNDDDVAACLLPTETGSPLAMIGILQLGNGTLNTVLQKAVGADERFEIYDVRATAEGMIWTEANVLEGAWRIYAAPLSGATPGAATLLEEGGESYETPTLAAIGNRAFWQVLPKLPNDQGLPSRLMAATFGKNDTACILESQRRMGTPPYAAQDSIVVTPRADSSSIYYQLTNISAETGEVLDQLTLPHAMLPLEAGYGRNGFMFSFPDIYDYGGGISNLGTYTPLSKPDDGNYDSARWFGFNRTPTAPPAWCGNLLIVKSSYSVCGVDLDANSYFAIDVDDGADTYGDYLASSGTHDTFVTYANIDHTPVEGDAKHVCRVKVWKPLTDEERKQRAEEEQQSSPTVDA